MRFIPISQLANRMENIFLEYTPLNPMLLNNITHWWDAQTFTRNTSKHLLTYSISPIKSSTLVNSSDIFDVCLNGQSQGSKRGQNMGFLQPSQYHTIIDHIGDYAQLSTMRTTVTPGFHWCCGVHSH